MSWTCNTIKDYLIVDASEPVSKIIPKLKKDKQVIVFDKEKYLGIVTRKNILKEGLFFPEVKIDSITYKPAIITSNTSNLDVAKIFVESGAHFLPVFDETKQKLECVLQRTDFLRTISNEIGNIAITPLINYNPITVSENDNLAKVLSIFQEKGISKLVVFDGKVKGVITLSTILGYFIHATQITRLQLQTTLVKQVMKSDIIILSKSDLLSKLIDTFVDKNVSSVLIMQNNELSGIVTKTNILEYYIYSLGQEIYEKPEVYISAKFSGIYKPDVEKKFESLYKFLGPNAKIFVYYKLGKEKFRTLPLVNCRLRIIEPKNTWNISTEGWGFEHATELAVQKLKRQMGDVRF
jgi:predicted transcriptional regulator